MRRELKATEVMAAVLPEEGGAERGSAGEPEEDGGDGKR
jgi:hypothetical protein